MRYSLLAVAVSCTLMLTACNKSTETAEPAADTTSSAATTAETTTQTQATPSADTGFKSAENIAMNITGAGASFPQPIYAKWSSDYNAATGGQVNYQSIGSSGGIKQIQSKTVDFGASDAPLTPEELEESGLIQFPTVIGGVVPIVNIDGVEPGQLKLDGETLANIYLGKINNWNDPAIKALNPDLTLPDAAITTVFRSDGSGTTFNFTDYLAKVSPDWKDSVGVDKTVKWPTSATGAGGKGNEGVSSYVNRMKTLSTMWSMPTPSKTTCHMPRLKMPRAISCSHLLKPLPPLVTSIGHNKKAFIKSSPTLRRIKHGQSLLLLSS